MSYQHVTAIGFILILPLDNGSMAAWEAIIGTDSGWVGGGIGREAAPDIADPHFWHINRGYICVLHMAWSNPINLGTGIETHEVPPRTTDGNLLTTSEHLAESN